MRGTAGMESSGGNSERYRSSRSGATGSCSLTLVTDCDPTATIPNTFRPYSTRASFCMAVAGWA